MHPADAQQVGDAVRDDPRLAAAGAGQNEQRPVAREHRVALRRVEIVEEVVQPGGHAKLYRIATRRHEPARRSKANPLEYWEDAGEAMARRLPTPSPC
jgi:hypothetical protein